MIDVLEGGRIVDLEVHHCNRAEFQSDEPSGIMVGLVLFSFSWGWTMTMTGLEAMAFAA